MANVVKFPPRFLHPERSVLAREILRLVRECGARNVPATWMRAAVARCGAA